MVRELPLSARQLLRPASRSRLSGVKNDAMVYSNYPSGAHLIRGQRSQGLP